MAKVIKRIKIEDLKIGDKIKTLNNGEVVFREVTDKFDTMVSVEDQRVVVLENGSKVRCSKRHPFMCLTDNGVIEVLPDDLTSDSEVLTETGQTTRVVEVAGDNQNERYIDITVDDTETFFASDSTESAPVLTHNCSQGGVRSSSVTMFYPFWHYEVEEMLVLKNNRGTEETRARHSDYGIKLNALFYKRVRDNTDISLFSPHVSKEMYEAFHSGDNEKFEELYVALEKDPLIRRKVINARELLNLIATERASTGRIYIVNIDHVNNHSSFNENVYQSNLCLIGETSLKAKVDGVEQTATIEQVTDWFKAGKKVEVLSCNTNSKVDEYKLVSDAAMTGKNKKVIKVTDSETGKFIICTPEHRVWTENRGYVEAKDLQPNDQLKIE